MSFAAPAFLVALLAVPAAAALYVRAQESRRRAAAAFSSPALLPAVAPQRPGWRRHAPMALYAAALAAVALALARPQTTVAVPEERASVVLATDKSGSMQATDVAPSRLGAVRSAARDFLDGVPGELRVGAVAFDHAVRAIESPTTDREEVRALLDRLRPGGGTATGEALAASLSMLRRQAARERERPPAAIVLLSDGTSTHGRDPMAEARAAARERVPVYTVALGTARGTIEGPAPGGTERRRVPPDRASLERIAELTRGRTFEAQDADALDTVYEQLGSQIGMRQEKREITAAFAAGAALLLAGGGLMSLGWFARLP